MIEVEITDKMLINAREKAREMGLLKNSIRNGTGSVAGFIGEQIAVQVLGGEWINDKGHSYEYDMVLPNGKTVEVKTKGRNVAPRPHYSCSVAKFNARQKCDMYGFVSILNDYSKGWFLGTIPKDKFFEIAESVEKDQHDPDNDYNARAACFNITIEELQNVQSDGNSMFSISS